MIAHYRLYGYDFLPKFGTVCPDNIPNTFFLLLLLLPAAATADVYFGFNPKYAAPTPSGGDRMAIFFSYLTNDQDSINLNNPPQSVWKRRR